jgi:hypothetical protein
MDQKDVQRQACSKAKIGENIPPRAKNLKILHENAFLIKNEYDAGELKTYELFLNF